MISELSKTLEGLVEFLFIAAPLTIQLILYPLGRLCFKKIPAHAMYWFCFIVNTFLLIFMSATLLSFDPSDKSPITDELVMTIIWAPWFIGILLWAIDKSIRETRTDKTEVSADNTDDIAIDEN